MAAETSIFPELAALALLVFFICFLKWLEKEAKKNGCGRLEPRELRSPKNPKWTTIRADRSRKSRRKNCLK